MRQNRLGTISRGIAALSLWLLATSPGIAWGASASSAIARVSAPAGDSIEAYRNQLVPNVRLSDSELKSLRTNGFVIVPTDQNEMFQLYDASYPFVTSDVMAHTVMVLLRAALNDLDQLVLKPDISAFSRLMAADCLLQSRNLKDARLRDLALRNAAVFSVPAALLSGSDTAVVPLSRPLAASVHAELAQIRDHKALAPSSLFRYREDFTKYAARGRYASTPGLIGYYQAMMYLGRMAFSLKSPDGASQTLLLLDVLRQDPEAYRMWARTDSLLTSLYGDHDDPTFLEASTVAGEVLQKGRPGTFSEIAMDSLKLQAYSQELLRRAKPRILDTDERRGSAGNAQGLRVLGQRFTRPAYVLRKVIRDGAWPPSGLDVASRLLASPKAREILRDRGRAFSQAADSVELRPAGNSLVERWIDAGRALFQVPSGAPGFMQTPMWEEKQINSALGTWVELQHSTVLYSKDANVATLGAHGTPDPTHGYVEPVPDYYLKLKSLTQDLARALEAVDLFARIAEDKARALSAIDGGATASPDSAAQLDRPREDVAEKLMRDYKRSARKRMASIRLERGQFDQLCGILDQLAAISNRELQGDSLAAGDIDFMRSIGGRLAYLAFDRSETRAPRTPMSLVVDVATEPRLGECFEIAVGRPWAIYVALPGSDRASSAGSTPDSGHTAGSGAGRTADSVPTPDSGHTYDSDRTYVCKGAVYSYHEFVRPVTSRLDDDAWKALSADANPPSAWLGTRPSFRISEGP